MTETILAAVDQSTRAVDVVRAATHLARCSGAKIVLFHAIDIPPEFPPAAATKSGDSLPAHLRTVATRALDALAREIDVPHTLVIVDAHRAWRAILDAANTQDADLVVIGSHGFDFIDHLLGTTAAKVVNLSKRDVFVVHRKREHA